MAFNLAKEKKKHKTIVAAIMLRADDLLNGVEEDVKVFLQRRGDPDAAQQAAKAKAELSKVIDDYIEYISNRG